LLWGNFIIIFEIFINVLDSNKNILALQLSQTVFLSSQYGGELQLFLLPLLAIGGVGLLALTTIGGVGLLTLPLLGPLPHGGIPQVPPLVGGRAGVLQAPPLVGGIAGVPQVPLLVGGCGGVEWLRPGLAHLQPTGTGFGLLQLQACFIIQRRIRGGKLHYPLEDHPVQNHPEPPLMHLPTSHGADILMELTIQDGRLVYLQNCVPWSFHSNFLCIRIDEAFM